MTHSSLAGGIAAVVTDVEGTTTPIAFVRDVLFPFARTRMAGFLSGSAENAEVVQALAAVQAEAPGRSPLAALVGWMDNDAKISPLKTLQGLIWREGYRDGALRGQVYDDVAPALMRWRQGGHQLFVYSSGSEEAQRLLFRHSTAGDLSSLLDGYFDTRIGGKREAASYTTLAGRIGRAPEAILFLSDVEAELDAAAQAGFRTCQVVRAADSTVKSSRHEAVGTFSAIRP